MTEFPPPTDISPIRCCTHAFARSPALSYPYPGSLIYPPAYLSMHILQALSLSLSSTSSLHLHKPMHILSSMPSLSRLSRSCVRIYPRTRPCILACTCTSVSPSPSRHHLPPPSLTSIFPTNPSSFFLHSPPPPPPPYPAHHVCFFVVVDCTGGVESRPSNYTAQLTLTLTLPLDCTGGVESRPSNYTAFIELGGKGLDTALTYGDATQEQVGAALKVGGTTVTRSHSLSLTQTHA